MESKVYPGISPEVFKAIQARAQSESGLNLTGNVGQAHSKGLTVEWTYDGATLTITPTAKKFPASLKSDAYIYAQLDKLVTGNGA